MTNAEPLYWLTTHWPPLVDRPHLHSVYLKAEHKAGCRIKAGDKVLVYEFIHGPTLVENGGRIKRRRGREAIILAVDVIDDFRERPPKLALQTYSDGGHANWKWEAATETIAAGEIPRREVNRVLDYRDGNYFRGFNHGKGYKQIEPERYAELLALLTPVR